MRRLFLILCLPLLLLLAACGAEPIWASDEEVARAAYVDDGPPSITLVTVINNRSGEGAHSGILINASQRVVFDPAGTWWHRAAPERNDVHYGMTPTMVDFYIDYHARETYRVVTQTVEVEPEVAERALRVAEAYGAVPKAFCAVSTGRILRQVPGFEDVNGGFLPARTMRSFAKLPGVVTKTYVDDDSDNNKALLLSQQSASLPVQPSQ